MSRLNYTPDHDIKLHEEGAIRLICKAFQSHENGFPEWLKNSADAYAREDAPEEKRIIVVIFDYGRKGITPTVSCLDFVGMTSTIIERDFRHWADPEAAIRGAKTTAIQGGHGNGGKCYMTQMFDEYVLIHTVKNGKGCKYGVAGGSIRFGYIPDPNQGREFAAANLKTELTNGLTPIRCSLQSLPEAAIKALGIGDGFTLITGSGPKGYSNRILVNELVDSLQEHPQMIQTLALCKVFVIVNGEPYRDGRALTLPRIKPKEGAEEPRSIKIPEILKDPTTGERLSSTNNGSSAPGILTLRTSDVSMKWSRKGRHSVIYRAISGYIGYIPVFELDVQSPFRENIYGECFLESLEPFKQNERARLATSPLTRAVAQFVSEQIQAFAKEFEAKERRRYDQEEKNALSKMNEALDRWKNRFLNELMQGLWGPGKGGTHPPPPPLPTGKAAKLELTMTHQKAGLGVAFRPTLKFFDSNGKRIRAVPFRWVSEDTNVAIVDEDLSVISTFTYGQTTIHAETLDRKILSNKVPLEVIRILEINITPNKLELPAGSRQKLEAVCRLANNEETTGVYLVWDENSPNVARVSSSGLVFGFTPGECEVTTGDDKCMAKSPALITVVTGEGGGKGNKQGRGYPQVLVSGEIDRDPDTNEYVNFSHEYPPVTQRPQDVDRNIWWINSASPLARLYLDTTKAYGYKSREWRMYHLERYIDVIVQIALTHGPTETESLSANDWITKWGYQVAEIQSAAASELGNFIATGELPENE